MERGGEIASAVPMAVAAFGAAVAAFIAGGFILVIMIGFGAVVGGFLGLGYLLAKRSVRGEPTESGDLGSGLAVPSGETQESAQQGETGFASPAARR